MSGSSALGLGIARSRETMLERKPAPEREAAVGSARPMLLPEPLHGRAPHARDRIRGAPRQGPQPLCEWNAEALLWSTKDTGRQVTGHGFLQQVFTLSILDLE